MNPDYPMLRLIERHGGWAAIALALLPPIAGVWAIVAGCSPWWLAAGLAGGAFAFAALRSFVELVRLMTDLLLPK